MAVSLVSYHLSRYFIIFSENYRIGRAGLGWAAGVKMTEEWLNMIIPQKDRFFLSDLYTFSLTILKIK